jgi:hypothetical protein
MTGNWWRHGGRAVATMGERLHKWVALGHHMQHCHFNLRQNFSQSCPMNIGGDRLFLRSDDYLYCIAE